MTNRTEPSDPTRSDARGKPPRRVQMEGCVSVEADVSVDALWAVVSDVTRVGEWSHECVSAEWLDGATEAVPGARFRGRNRSGVWRWGRVCEIVSADPYTLVWRTVPTPLSPDSSEWRIELAPSETGARITQEFQVVKAPRILAIVYAWIIPGHRDRTAALTRDLERLAAAAGAAGPGD